MIKRTLQELCLNITDGKHGDCENEENSGYYFISCKDIFDGQINYKKARQITKADFEETHKRTMLEVDDILLTNSGTIGRMAFVTDREATTKTTFQKSVAIIKPDKQKVLPRYLYYQLQNCVPQFINSSNGSAQKNLLLSTMRTFQIEIEENCEKQEKIANTLFAYDDLIENNQRQIKLLEEAAQRLYKEWFVDLRFPGHENTKIVDGVPEGWNWCKLEDAIQFDPKVTLTKERMKQFIPMSALSTSSMVLDESQFTETTSNSGSKFQNGDTLLARITPCLENGKTAYVSGLKSSEGAVGSTEYIVMRAKTINAYMVYLLARTDDFRQSAINSMSGSDGRQRVKSDKLKMLDYLHPTSELVEKFENVEEPIFEKIYRLSKQMQQAKQARDLLLPKLMSGEVEV
ncbi:restriction endonuclease subunit S [Faecalibacterium prausnitzii]|uniref:restriction endonuclease subunit S n=1 Tax=Faecalibacterium prausnitzii TaxID=853 RepID=UPI003F1DC99E